MNGRDDRAMQHDGNDCLWSTWACLRCGKRSLTSEHGAIVCRECWQEYPLFDGVPAFVRDPVVHQARMSELTRERPTWFTSKQLDPGQWRAVRAGVDRQIAEMLHRHTRPGALALDLGCGDGRNLQKLRAVGLRCVGVDYNILRLTRAAEGRQSEYEFLFMADAKDMPVPDDFFDVVYCDQVLEHISDPGAVLRTIRRMLKDDGVLILGVPNEGCWYFQLKFRLKPSLKANTDHVNFFTARSLTDLLVENGFEVREIFGTTWGLPATGNRLLALPSTMDRALRNFGWYNKAWELFGRVFLPGQYFELYTVSRIHRTHAGPA